MSKFSIEEGKKGFLTLKYMDRYIHSKIDPVKEAERLIPENINSNLFMILGLGLGYHLEVLLKKLEGKKCTLFVFEENQDLIQLYSRYGIVHDSRVIVFHSKDFDQFIHYFEKNIQAESIEHPVFIELKSETVIFKNEYEKLRKRIEEFFRYHFQSLFTEAEFNILWYKNLIINSERIFNPAFNLFLEGDALLISAGPTLARNIPLLKSLYKKVPFFCVDTALKPLVESGMIPEIIIASDAQIHNYKDFYHLPDQVFKQSILACDVTVYYKIPELFSKVYFYRTENTADLFFEELNHSFGLSLPVFPSGGSVAASAFSLAYYLGVENMMMVGQDLGYSQITHSRGTVHFDRALIQSNKKETLLNFFQKIVFKRGKQDLFLKNLMRWMEDFIYLVRQTVYQIDPFVPLKNSNFGLPLDPYGRICLFQKLSNRKSEVSLILGLFLEKLVKLRKADTLEVFMKIRKDNLFQEAIDKLFLKQDLYLNRKQGNEQLYLGACYRIIDRIIRAVEYLMKRKKNEL
ncbi:MAG TPA: hypothetical protein DHW82_11910 [Spirochaetia bacterium]|nr:MAG: hypothetical protein A2Y41_12450 [Spirochaetes bacterium GWB1_36_13]HCL57696.1 hypothetical protein [Spirochaetia bacterium]